jgi:hypothetical protein
VYKFLTSKSTPNCVFIISNCVYSMSQISIIYITMLTIINSSYSTNITDFASQFSHRIHNIYLYQMYRRVIPINSVIPNTRLSGNKSFTISIIFMLKVLHVFCFQIAHWSCILYFLEGVDDKIVIVVHSPFSKHFRA